MGTVQGGGVGIGGPEVRAQATAARLAKDVADGPELRVDGSDGGAVRVVDLGRLDVEGFIVVEGVGQLPGVEIGASKAAQPLEVEARLDLVGALAVHLGGIAQADFQKAGRGQAQAVIVVADAELVGAVEALVGKACPGLAQALQAGHGAPAAGEGHGMPGVERDEQ